MSLTHTSQLTQFIPTSAIQKTAGTWTPTITGHVPCDTRTAAAATFDLEIPLVLPGSVNGLEGAKITAVDVWYSIGTADLTSMAGVDIYQLALNPDTDAITGVKITTTLDSAHNTSAKRKAQAAHKMTVSISEPTFLEENTALVLEINAEAAATSVFKLFGAQVHFTLRA